jgi:hypothetical protein
MEKTYNALIERLRLSAEWHKRKGEALAKQHDLNDYEKESILKDKAITEWIEMVIRRETA